MSHSLRITVVIPTFNEACQITRSVQSALDAGATEVIVADGGSADDTKRMAQAAGATVLDSRKGRAVQLNAGAAAAVNSDVFLFLHADNWLDVTCLRQVTQVCEPEKPVMGAFCQRIDALGVKYRLLEMGNGFRARRMRQPYGDQGIFVSADLFRDVGCFPEVPLMEELYLVRRIRRITRPLLLPGPIHVDARRWKENGVFRQTIRNWSLVTRYLCGVDPKRLVGEYPDHVPFENDVTDSAETSP